MDLEDCQKCLKNKSISELLFLDCEHRYCIQCLNKYISKRILEGNFNLECLKRDCEKQISYSIIRQVVSDDIFNHYDNYQTRIAIPNSVRCLMDSSCGFVALPNQELNFFICANCGIHNCLLCGKCHANLTCKQFEAMEDGGKEEFVKTQKTDALYMIDVQTKTQNRNNIMKACKKDLLVNSDVFECSLCSCYVAMGNGITLKSCFHNFCRDDLISYIKSTVDYPIVCPEYNCGLPLMDTEIAALLTEKEYSLYRKYSLNYSKRNFTNLFQCQQYDCDYFCELSQSTLGSIFNISQKFKCPKCQSVNCLTCYAVHAKMSCEDYQHKTIESNQLVFARIKEGSLMRCPDCFVLLEKVSGCNWLQCNNCGQQLCWILKMRRWGPKGEGDTSGGCKCGVDNVLCHPNCTGCYPGNTFKPYRAIKNRIENEKSEEYCILS